MNGVMFNDIHSYKDWGLYLKSRPVISPPEPKTTYFNVLGCNGVIDATESLTGSVKYENRTIIMEFVVADARSEWSNIYSKILNYLHGKRIKIIFDEDNSYFYIGRFKVNEWASDKSISTIVIEGSVDPYKYSIEESTDDWLWDPFNFEVGIIDENAVFVLSEEHSYTIPPSYMPFVPVIYASNITSAITMTDGTNTYSIEEGRNRFPEIIVKKADVTLTFTGSGDISIEYRRGSL